MNWNLDYGKYDLEVFCHFLLQIDRGKQDLEKTWLNKV